MPRFGGELVTDDQPKAPRFAGVAVTDEDFPTGEGEFASSHRPSGVDNRLLQDFRRTDEGLRLKPPPSAEDKRRERALTNARVQLSLARGVPEKEQALVESLFEDAVIEKDADGNALVTIPSMGVEREFINEPGLSLRDVDQTAAPLLAMLGPARAVGMLRSLATRATATGALAAGETQLQDRAVEQLTDGAAPVDNTDSVIAGLLGVGFEVVPAPVINAIGRMFQRSDGVVTQPLRDALARFGVNADDLTRDQIIAVQQMGNRPAAEIQDMLNRNLGLEFNVPQTRADRTGDPRDAVREAAARQRSPEVFAAFDERRDQALIDASREAIPSRLNNGTQENFSEVEAGARIQQGLTDRRASLDQRIDDAYAEFREKNAELDARGFVDFFTSQREALDEIADLPIGQSTTPVTRQALNDFENLADEVARGLDQPGVISGAVDIQRMERFRKRMVNYRRAAESQNPTDFAAMRALIRNYDQFMVDAVDNSLIRGRDAGEVIESITKARGLHAQMMRQYNAEPGDQVGRMIEKIVGEDAGDAAVANFIFGRAELGGKEASLGVVRRIRDIAGEDSREWSALRDMAFLRLVNPATTGRSFDKAVFLRHFNEAMTGRGSDIMRELYNVDERAMLNRFAAIVRNSTPKDLRNGHRFAGRVREALEEYTKQRGRGTVFQGQAVKGTIIRMLPELINEQFARRAINGSPPVGDSLLAKALRPFVITADGSETVEDLLAD